MDKIARLQLKHEIQSFMTKNPNVKTSEVKKFVFSGENPPDISDTSPRALKKFISTT